MYSLLGLIILILDILIIIRVLQSRRPIEYKLLWIVVILLFPLLGILLYYLLADRKIA